MDATEIKYFVEAALLAAGRPLSISQLQDLFDGRMTPEKSEIRQAIGELNEEYEPRGILISEVASGFRVQVKASMADQLQKLWEERAPRYSRALFETLALIAYRQPITRGEIEDVRGVSVSPNIVRTLIEREWVRVVGHRDVPGRPEMFGTTKSFLDYFGLKKLEDLPPLADLADWESLRIQLDLPDVERAGESESAPVTDLPVLYPEIPDDDQEAMEETAAEEPVSEADDGDEALPELKPMSEDTDANADEDELMVSEWPDPAKSGG
jgi:segregation and condensation protein B